MQYGDGVVGIFIAFLDIIETFAIGIITALAVIYFFWIIVKYIFTLRNGGDVKPLKQQIPWAILLLTIMFSTYGLIYIFADIFGLANTSNPPVYFR